MMTLFSMIMIPFRFCLLPMGKTQKRPWGFRYPTGAENFDGR
jgi:hypothetical protein